MTYLVHIFVALLALISLRRGEELESSSERKLNVVLFMARTATSETYFQDSGIKYLHFVKKSNVKHVTAGTEATPLDNECKSLLKTGMYSLISYCRNVMGMTTAVASVENDTFSNGLRLKKSTKEDLEIRYHYPRKFRNRVVNSIRPSKTQYITQPEHTEVFKIRSKRQALPEVPNFDNESETIPPKWDVFGIMANIKLTFFGKLFEKDKTCDNKQEAVQNEEMNQIGKVTENCIFDLVKETLANLQDGGDSSFLMIVLGGRLTEICDTYSSLMQSVKHVVENTDERSTLIVVTGSCPFVDQEGAIEDQYTIPVYVKGPQTTACGMNISGQLYDVPYAIKNLLADIGGGDFPGMRGRRQKRHNLAPREKRSQGSLATFSAVLILECILIVCLVH